MITGSYPPDFCGVGDYTKTLVENLSDSYKVSVLKLNFMNFWSSVFLAKKYDIIHIQYPTVGYGYSLTPHFYSIFVKSTVTIHEFTQINSLRRFSIALFSLRSKVILTNDFEFNALIKAFPWTGSRSHVIPIGSSIPSKNIFDDEKRKERIVYFGLIRPNKGIEEFLELKRLALKQNFQHLGFSLIGGVSDNEVEYSEKVLTECKELGIQLKLNVDPMEVARLLASSKYGYLHFPDGATERRSSLLAMLSSGLVTFTTKSKMTPSSFNDAMIFVEKPKEVLEIILSDPSGSALAKKRASIGFRKKYDWSNIVERHKSIYSN